MPAVDLSNYVLTLNEDFNALSIGRTGSGATWTPQLWNGASFGESKFVDGLSAPTVDPFAVKNGNLEITARETASGWTGGLISSVDPLGNGFTQKYGYFEMRAELPVAADAWPAFWLLGTETLKGGPIREIDIMEVQSDNPNRTFQTMHSFATGKEVVNTDNQYHQAGLSEGFHTYGFLWTAEKLAWYVDGVETRSLATPADFHAPMYIVADLAVGTWANLRATGPDVNSMTMKIDYIRAYSDSPTAVPASAKTPIATQPLSAGATSPYGSAEAWTGDYRMPDYVKDVVVKNGGSHNIWGNALDNLIVLNGGPRDHVEAGAGNDTIVVGAGKPDILLGAGRDTVVFTNPTAMGVEIMDFTAEDRIDLRPLLAAQGYTGSNAVADRQVWVTSEPDGNTVTLAIRVNNTVHWLASLHGVPKLEVGDRLLVSGSPLGSVNYDISQVTSGINANVSVASGYGTASSVNGGLADVLVSVKDVTGTAYNDALTGSSASNVLKGMGGDDSLSGGGGVDTLSGGAGNDTLSATAGSLLEGGEGNDVFQLSNDGHSQVRISGGTAWGVASGVDTVVIVDKASTGVHADLAGWVMRMDTKETLAALSKVTNFKGSANGDVVAGDAEANLIEGGGGVDWLDGRGGDDTLAATSGSTLVGGAGDDVFNVTVAPGAQVNIVGGIHGGADTGIDKIVFADAGLVGVEVHLAEPGGNGWGISLNTRKSLVSFSGIENVTGGAGADVLIGNSQANVIAGGGGRDWVLGGAGKDVFLSDIFAGMTRFDTTIGDFKSGEDKLAFSGGQMTLTTVRHAGVAGELVANSGSWGTTLNGYVDADAKVDFVITLSGAPQFTAQDLIFV